MSSGSFVISRKRSRKRSFVRPICSFSMRMKFLNECFDDYHNSMILQSRLEIKNSPGRHKHTDYHKLTQTTLLKISQMDKIVFVSSLCSAVIFRAINLNAQENRKIISWTIAKIQFEYLLSSQAYRNGKMVFCRLCGCGGVRGGRISTFPVIPNLGSNPTKDNTQMRRSQRPPKERNSGDLALQRLAN